MERIAASMVKKTRPGQTAGDWLAGTFPYQRADEWLAHMASGLVSVNGKPCLSDTVVAVNDRITFDISGFPEPEVRLSHEIIFEDDDFLAAYKPPLLPVHPAGRYFKNTLWHILKGKHPYVHIATRLDRETSGIVLVCKNAIAARHAAHAQASGEIRKTYLAAVHGEFPAALEAQGYLTRDTSSAVRKKRKFILAVSESEPHAPPGEIPDAENCETSFSLLERSAGFSLVRAIPVTGRTHQIRSTLRSLGYPVAGDKLYGLDETLFLRFAEDALTDDDRKSLIMPFQALHCRAISFIALDGTRVSVPTARGMEGIRFQASIYGRIRREREHLSQ